jgi:hypothetical protein
VRGPDFPGFLLRLRGQLHYCLGLRTSKKGPNKGPDFDSRRGRAYPAFERLLFCVVGQVGPLGNHPAQEHACPALGRRRGTR